MTRQRARNRELAAFGAALAALRRPGDRVSVRIGLQKATETVRYRLFCSEFFRFLYNRAALGGGYPASDHGA